MKEKLNKNKYIGKIKQSLKKKIPKADIIEESKEPQDRYHQQPMILTMVSAQNEECKVEDFELDDINIFKYSIPED